RWTSPATWIAASAAATPSATPCNGPGSSAPYAEICSERGVPAMYSVTMYGRPSPVSPLSSTCAVQNDATRRALSTSAWNRAANPSWLANSAFTTLTATNRPVGARARKTVPMPPSPSRPSSRYGPISRKSLGRSGAAPVGSIRDVPSCSTQSSPHPTPVRHHRFFDARHLLDDEAPGPSRNTYFGEQARSAPHQKARPELRDRR